MTVGSLELRGYGSKPICMNKENTVNRRVGCRFSLATVVTVLASLSVQAQEPLINKAGSGVPVNQVVATIPLNAGSGNAYEGYLGLAVTPDNKYVYIETGLVNAIVVLDAKTNTLTSSSIPTSNNPQQIAITPDGKTLYSCDVVGNNQQGDDGPGAVTVVDGVSTANPAFKETIQGLGQWPMAIAINPKGTLAYITNYASNFISVLDVKTNQLQPVPLMAGDGPTSVALTPSGKYAYVCNQSDNDVIIIDTATGLIVGNPIELNGPPGPGGQGPGCIVITPDGKKAYVHNHDNATVSVIDVATNTVTTSFYANHASFGEPRDQSAITPDGNYLYVPVEDPGGVVMISTKTDSIVGNPIDNNFTDPTQIAIAPDGTRAYVLDNSGTLTVLNITDKTITSSTP
jgi:YVTN family beta-propeller protein